MKPVRKGLCVSMLSVHSSSSLKSIHFFMSRYPVRSDGIDGGVISWASLIRQFVDIQKRQEQVELSEWKAPRKLMFIFVQIDLSREYLCYESSIGISEGLQLSLPNPQRNWDLYPYPWELMKNKMTTDIYIPLIGRGGPPARSRNGQRTADGCADCSLWSTATGVNADLR